MRNYSILFLFCILSVTTVFADILSPITIRDQISKSDGFVMGIVEEVSLYDDVVAGGNYTKVFIRAEQWLGDFDVSQTQEIEVHFRKGVNVSIGEVVVVLTRADELKKHWILNSGLGKFSLKRVGHKKVLVNQVFPTTPRVGQISLDNFLNLVIMSKGKKPLERYKNKYEIIFEKEFFAKTQASGSGRKIASQGASNEVVEVHKVRAHWLVVILALFSFISVFIRSKVL